MNVPKEKIREVIGTGGKVIREIVEQTGCKVDIEDDGTIKIAATDSLAGAARRSTGSAASWRSPRSASSTTARW